MSIEVSWDNGPHTIIRYDFFEQWTWEEMEAALIEANQMMATVPHTVDIIIDMSQGWRLPRGNLLVRGKRIMVTMPPDNMGLTVVTGGSAFAETIASALVRVYRRLGEKILFTSSLDDARRLIAERRQADRPTSADV